ncbi:hypothetical protein [Cyclobacterium sediminis]
MKTSKKSIVLMGVILLSITSCEFLGSKEDILPKSTNGIETSMESFGSEKGNERPIRSRN